MTNINEIILLLEKMLKANRLDREATNRAIKVLKQRLSSRKPRVENYCAYCPSCGKEFRFSKPYCSTCGQLMDWSDE